MPGEVKINMTRYIEMMIEEFTFKDELKKGIKLQQEITYLK